MPWIIALLSLIVGYFLILGALAWSAYKAKIEGDRMVLILIFKNAQVLVEAVMWDLFRLKSWYYQNVSIMVIDDKSDDDTFTSSKISLLIPEETKTFLALVTKTASVLGSFSTKSIPFSKPNKKTLVDRASASMDFSVMIETLTKLFLCWTKTVFLLLPVLLRKDNLRWKKFFAIMHFLLKRPFKKGNG
jgi:hypothetical protein